MTADLTDWDSWPLSFRYAVQTLADAEGSGSGHSIVTDLHRCPQCALARLPEGEPMALFDRWLRTGCKVCRIERTVTVIPLRALPTGELVELAPQFVRIDDRHAPKIAPTLHPTDVLAEAERILAEAR